MNQPAKNQEQAKKNIQETMGKITHIVDQIAISCEQHDSLFMLSTRLKTQLEEYLQHAPMYALS